MRDGIRNPAVWCLVWTVAAVTALVVSAYTGAAGGTWFKMAASTGFVALAVASGALQGAYGRTILTALVCCWWGDLFLTRGGDHYFLLGLVAFLLGHVAYAAAFLVHGVRATWLAAGAMIALTAALPILRWLQPHLDTMRYPVYAYMAVISLMLALAIGTRGRGGTCLILAGAVLFYVSDIFVARQRFVAPGPENSLLGLPFYYVAQVLLAGSVARVNQRGG